MPSYLVLEEDGTSRLELEESADDLYLEEDGPWTNHTVNVDDFVNDGILPDPGIQDSASPVNRTDVNYTVNPADGVALADSQTVRLPAHGQSPADTVAVSDNAVPKYVWANYTASPSDSVAVSDVTNRNLNVDTGAYQTEDASAEQLETEEGDSNLLLEETGGWTNYTVTPADNVAVSDYQHIIHNGRRVSQVPVEVVVTSSAPPARVSQVPVEVVWQGGDQKARISQAAVEVVVQTIPGARFSQVPVEVVAAPLNNARQRYYDAVRLDYPDGMWRLDEATGNFIDDSGNHPFIPYGTVAYQVDGPTGSDWPAMEATGGGGASQPSYSTAMDDITFEGWFMYSAISADNQVIFSNVNGGNGWALTLNQNGKLQVVVNGSTYLAESQTALAPGTWYHIVVERRSGTWRYYVNGDIDTPNAGTATPGSAVTTMNLFGSADMTASMATAAYYERALTGQEIKQHYHAVFESTLRYPEFQAHFVARVIDPLDSSTWIVDDVRNPLAVIFMGTNFSATDTIVTTTGLGIFRGMISIDPDTGQQIQAATSPVYPGDGQRVSESQAICMGNASGGIHYSATVTMTDTGFECDFDNVGAGTVVALVLKDANNCVMIHGASGTYEIGFRGRSHLAGGWWDVVGNRPNMHGCWFGGGQWQSLNDLDFEGVGMTAHCYPTSNSSQFSSELTHASLSNGMFGITYAFIGPFMRGANLHALVPESVDGATLYTDVDGNGPGSFVVWDGMSNCGFLTTPVTAAATPIETVLADPEFAPGCVITYAASDVYQGQGNSGIAPPGGLGAGGFGIALEDGFRWAVLVDGGSSDGTVPGAAYQTFDHAWISAVDPSGVHMGDLEFTDTGFIADTTTDSFAQRGVLFHAMGLPIPSVMWIPQMSRHKL